MTKFGKYRLWIRVYNHKNPNVRGMCEQATLYMIAEFPELIRVRGHVSHILSNKLSTHWWCKDKDDIIWDPTSSQFGAIIEYFEHDESQPEPTGKCPNCGEYCYDFNTCCCNKCSLNYKEYISRSLL